MSKPSLQEVLEGKVEDIDMDMKKTSLDVQVPDNFCVECEVNFFRFPPQLRIPLLLYDAQPVTTSIAPYASILSTEKEIVPLI
jgi:hypothetical protein